MSALPIVEAAARNSDGRGSTTSHSGPSASKAGQASDRKADRRADPTDDAVGHASAKQSGKAAAKGQGRVSAAAATRAAADKRGATADAAAKAKARGPSAITKTSTKTFTVDKPRFQGAIAIAQAVARVFRSKAAARQQDDPLAGIAKPRALFGQALADAKAKARAAGPRTLTYTLADTFTSKTPSSLTAQAFSASTALSYVGRLAFAVTGDGFVPVEKAHDDEAQSGASGGSSRQPAAFVGDADEGPAADGPTGVCTVSPTTRGC
jgi:hypothetical protein